MKKMIVFPGFILACLYTTSYGQELKFEVKYKGAVLQREQIIVIRDYEMQGDNMVMQFDPDVTNISPSAYGMILMKEEINVVKNTQNTVCWDQCMSPDMSYATSAVIEPGVSQKPYGDLVINYNGEPVAGTSIIKYTFMTNNPEDANMSVEVSFIYEPATTQKEGSVITLGGHWQLSDFEALDLSEASITAVDMTGITIPGELPGFNPANPNLLIYVPQEATIPEGWKNVVKGEEAESILLTDGFPFQNTKEFKARSVSYKREFAGTEWTTGCLPFEITEIPEGIKAEQMYELVKTDIRFKDTTALAANTPYLLRAEKAGEYTFNVTDMKVPVTQMEKVVSGNYTFTVTLLAEEPKEQTDLFTLNNDGTAFEKANEPQALPPFRACIKLNQPDGNLTSIGIIHGESGTEGTMTDKSPLEIRVNEGKLLIRNTQRQLIHIYTIDGNLLQELILDSGTHRINDLDKGVYLVGGKKVLL